MRARNFIPIRSAAIAACLLMLAAGPVAAEVTTYPSASTAGQYLAVPAGARPAALGTAFTAVAGDLNALAWNPAGLTGLPDHRLLLSHLSWIQGINSERIAYGQPVENFGTVGIGVNYLGYGAIERWNMDGSGNPVATGDTYAPSVLGGEIGWAVPVGPGTAAGAVLKMDWEQIDGGASLAGGLDLGAQVSPWQDVCLGAAVRNLGLAAGEKWLPVTLSLGAAYVLPYSFSENDWLTALADVTFKPDDNPLAGAGLEYTYRSLFQVRAGWNPNFGRTVPGRLGLTAGAGLSYRRWSLDYAFAPQGDLGVSHQVSLQYGFY